MHSIVTVFLHELLYSVHVHGENGEAKNDLRNFKYIYYYLKRTIIFTINLYFVYCIQTEFVTLLGVLFVSSCFFSFFYHLIIYISEGIEGM